MARRLFVFVAHTHTHTHTRPIAIIAASPTRTITSSRGRCHRTCRLMHASRPMQQRSDGRGTSRFGGRVHECSSVGGRGQGHGDVPPLAQRGRAVRGPTCSRPPLSFRFLTSRPRLPHREFSRINRAIVPAQVDGKLGRHHFDGGAIRVRGDLGGGAEAVVPRRPVAKCGALLWPNR